MLTVKVLGLSSSKLDFATNRKASTKYEVSALNTWHKSKSQAEHAAAAETQLTMGKTQKKELSLLDYF